MGKQKSLTVRLVVLLTPELSALVEAAAREQLTSASNIGRLALQKFLSDDAIKNSTVAREGNQ